MLTPEAESAFEEYERINQFFNGPKELWVVEDAGHFDFYHNPVCIEKTVDKIAEFFGKTL